jgi:prefoldin subunit 5
VGIFVSLAAVFTSLKLAEFGERMGEKAGTGLDAARQEAAKRLEGSLSGLLDGFRSQLKGDLQSVVDTVQGAVSFATRSFDQRAKALEDRISRLQKELDGLAEKHSALLANYSVVADGYNSMLKEHREATDALRRELESLRNERGQLKALRKVYERLKEVLEEKEVEGIPGGAPTANERATLTREDGEASRSIGREAEREFAEYFRGLGFEADERRGEGDPDIALKSSGKPVAFVNTKSYMLYDEPKRNQRRIGLDDVIPEKAAAGRFKVPMVVAVRNRRNGRIWLCLVPCEELAGWEGISTPLILSKDDPESAKQLEETVRRVLRMLGANV